MLDYKALKSEVLKLDVAPVSTGSGILFYVDVRGASTMGAQLRANNPAAITSVIEVRGSVIGPDSFVALATAPTLIGSGLFTFSNSGASTSQNYLDVTGLAYVGFVLTTAGASGETGTIGVILKGPGGVSTSPAVSSSGSGKTTF